MARYGTSMNLDGIWGGNMYAGGAGAILPNKITSKHNFRYLPNRTGSTSRKKLRAHLDKQGFADVEMKVIGDVPWAKMRYDTDIAKALARTYDIFGIRYNAARRRAVDPRPVLAGVSLRRQTRSTSRSSAARQGTAASHAANEYFVIEGAGQGLRHGRRREIRRHGPLQLRGTQRLARPRHN